MVRLLHARRAVLATVEVNDGQLRVTSVGPLRQLWFQGKDGQHLQTEVVLRDGQVDLRRSLRRTPYLNFMAAQLRSADVKEVLVCGLGGGLLPHVLSSWGIQVLALERSGEVLDLARRFFGLAPAVTPLEIQKNLRGRL
ncbi:unnamed protein product [Durusdinium trenchii]|uniref:Spermidine synthase n=1 Tax=Durusdinium trenchii TaxID=1381693 RepID=A0ABP0M1F5_9DINO